MIILIFSNCTNSEKETKVANNNSKTLDNNISSDSINIKRNQIDDSDSLNLILEDSIIKRNIIFTITTDQLANLKQMEKENAFENDISYYYFTTYFDLIRKDSLEYYIDCDTCICGYTLFFDNNIKYRANWCAEHGVGIDIEIPLMPLDSVRYFVETLFSNPENYWEDSSKYYPIEGEAGCYYDIREKNNSYVIEGYCGC